VILFEVKETTEDEATTVALSTKAEEAGIGSLESFEAEEAEAAFILIKETLGEDDLRRNKRGSASLPPLLFALQPLRAGGASKDGVSVKGTLSTTVGKGLMAGKTPLMEAGWGTAEAIMAMMPMPGWGTGAGNPLGLRLPIDMPIPTGNG